MIFKIGLNGGTINDGIKNLAYIKFNKMAANPFEVIIEIIKN
jgi:hypothetical protein